VKARILFQGVPICLDRPKGFKMEGVDASGNPWERTYKYDYGYIPQTLGGDDDGLDVFIGPDKNAEHAYWAVQKKDDGSFDEYKVFLGFPNREAATGAYKEHIPSKLLASLTTMRVDMMRSMLGINPKGLAKMASMLDELENAKTELGELGQKIQERLPQRAAVRLGDRLRDRLRERLN